MKKLLLVLTFIIWADNGYSQNRHHIDSLLNELKKFETHKKDLGNNITPLTDSTIANILDSISEDYWAAKPDTALLYAAQEMALSEKIGYKRGIGSAYNSMGAVSAYKGDMPTALEYFIKAAKTYEQTSYKRGCAIAYNNMGIVYEQLHNYTAALNSRLKALGIETEMGDKKGMADVYLDIGNLYHLNLDDFGNGLAYYQKALPLYEKTGDKNGIAYTNYFIGYCYLSMGSYPEALTAALIALKKYGSSNLGRAMSYEIIGQICEAQYNYSEAISNFKSELKISEQEDIKVRIYTSYCYIGEAYFKEGNYTEARANELKALQLSEEAKDENWSSLSHIYLARIYEVEGNYTEALNNYLPILKIVGGKKECTLSALVGVGKVYEKQGNLKEALKKELEGLQLARELGAKDNIKDAHQELAIINAKLNNYKDAYNNEVLFKQYYDTIYNKENEKKLTSLQLTYEFNKQQDSIKLEQGKKDAVSKQQLQKQKAYTGAGIAGFTMVMLLLFFVYRNYTNQRKATVAITVAHQQSEALLLNILPAEVAQELKQKGSADAKLFDDVTVLFTDFKNFTTISERLTPQQLVDELHSCFKAFDGIMEKYKIEKIKTVGDAYMAASGLPMANPAHAEIIVRAALEIKDFMLNRRKELGEATFEVRIGINSGKVVAGIVGVKKFAYDIWGDTVNTAARMEQNGEPGKVNISGSTYELVKDKFACEFRGEIEAKNKGKLKMYFISA